MMNRDNPAAADASEALAHELASVDKAIYNPCSVRVGPFYHPTPPFPVSYIEAKPQTKRPPETERGLIIDEVQLLQRKYATDHLRTLIATIEAKKTLQPTEVKDVLRVMCVRLESITSTQSLLDQRLFEVFALINANTDVGKYARQTADENRARLDLRDQVLLKKVRSEVRKEFAIVAARVVASAQKMVAEADVSLCDQITQHLQHTETRVKTFALKLVTENDISLGKKITQRLQLLESSIKEKISRLERSLR